MDYGESKNVTVKTEGATGITAKIDNNPVRVVNNYTIPISDLAADKYALTVTTIPDGDYNPVTKIVNITVNKVNSTLTIDDIVFDYNTSGSSNVSFAGATGVNACVVNQTKAVVYVKGDIITISNLTAGNYTLQVTTIADANHTSVSKTVSVTVNKVDSELTVDDVVFDYGGSGSVNVSFAGATGVNASVVNHSEAIVKVNKGKITVSNLNAGKYTLSVTTVPDANHNSVTKTANVTVDKADSSVSVGDVEAIYGDIVNITAVCVNATKISAKLYGDEVDANITVKGFNILISGLGAGNYTLKVTTITDDNHNAASNSSSIIINKADITLILANASDINPTETETINVELSDFNIDGNLTYTIKGKTYAVENYTITLNNLTEDTYTVLVELINDTNYSNASNKTTFTVRKVDYNITVESDDVMVNETAYVVITLPGDATGNVSVTVNGDTQVVPINSSTVYGLNGVLSMVVSYDNLSAGNYNVTAVYNGNNKYNPSNASSNFTVSKYDDYSVDLDYENKTVVVTLPEDATGNVTVVIGNNTYSGEIDNGSVIIDVSDLDVGNYTATVNYSGDDKYGEYTGNFNISVPSNFNLTAPSVVKYYLGSERLYVYLLYVDGNPVSNASLNITLNGVTYKRVTDENGTASMAINLAAGEYDVLVTYNGTEQLSLNTSVTVKATVNGTDVVKVFKNGTQYYATFRDSEGNYLADGTFVKFNINGVLYDRKVSGNEGLAKLNINLAAGEYILTAINPVNGEKSSNNITVISRIIENKDS